MESESCGIMKLQIKICEIIRKTSKVVNECVILLYVDKTFIMRNNTVK